MKKIIIYGLMVLMMTSLVVGIGLRVDQDSSDYGLYVSQAGTTRAGAFDTTSTSNIATLLVNNKGFGSGTNYIDFLIGGTSGGQSWFRRDLPSNETGQAMILAQNMNYDDNQQTIKAETNSDVGVALFRNNYDGSATVDTVIADGRSTLGVNQFRSSIGSGQVAPLVYIADGNLSNTEHALYSYNADTTGKAGYFDGDVYIDGALNVSGGYGGTSPFMMSKDADVGYSRTCAFSPTGNHNLYTYTDTGITVSVNDPVCTEKQAKIDFQREQRANGVLIEDGTEEVCEDEVCKEVTNYRPVGYTDVEYKGGKAQLKAGRETVEGQQIGG